MDNYIKRIIDKKIEKLLKISGGILIVGPRNSGKTKTASQFANSKIELNIPKQYQRAKNDLNEVLIGDTPRLIDEWQLIRQLFNLVKSEIDDRGMAGQFILSGSSAPDDDLTMHSGAGRIMKILLRPMSLFESNDSSREVNFKDLFVADQKIAGKKEFSTKFYVDKILRGGWPNNIKLNINGNDAKTLINGYIDSVVDVDMRKLKSPPDPIRMRELIKAIARNVGTQASMKKLGEEADIVQDADGGNKTIRKYLDQLTQVFVLEELQVWKAHARSSVRLVEKPKWYFIDPSIEVASLNLGYEKLMNDANYLGFVFESLVIRDLRIYAEAMDGNVFFFKDSNGYDVDAIVELPDGSWSAFEIKLGSYDGIEAGVENVKKIKDKVADRNKNNLKSLNIITIGTGSYTRDDGINIIELGNLYIN
ncbi:MAG: DUF4143 domain-containing protein [Mycoplasmataceae bacterium]|nr:DUF4143 domain-containing protein [Mycoplasmataceae bacterium]